MFTGIIEEIGYISNIDKLNENYKLKIQCEKVLKDTNLGDSISTNGVCLTISQLGKDFFIADVMNETIKRSNLSNLKTNSKVNLERALTLNTRLGGHIVTGHIDGTGEIINIVNDKKSIWYTVKPKTELLRYIVEKGSITIDGISLTVAYVDDFIFKVSIIPHTQSETILNYTKIGDLVNLEVDILGKYVEKLLTPQKENTVTYDLLSRAGFL